MAEDFTHSFSHRRDQHPRRQLLHVVLTRFNLATGGREAPIRNQPGWLTKRFDLFERYCLPSMAAQTCQEFEWIVFFDDATPEDFRRRIEKEQQVRKFYPYFTPLFDRSGWIEAIFSVTELRNASILLTTVLDNDDALANDYVSILQNAAIDQKKHSRLAFNFTNGYVLNSDRIYYHRHKNNAFINYKEPLNRDAKTAMNLPHMRLAKHSDVVQLQGLGAWLQVVHGDNVSNRTRGRLVSKNFEDRNLERFPPSALAEIVDPSWTEVLMDRIFREGPVTSRDLAIGIFHKIGIINPILHFGELNIGRRDRCVTRLKKGKGNSQSEKP
jgi:hypothetical protein